MSSAAVGEIVAIHLCSATRAPMRSVSTASVVETGIDGDRHAAPEGSRKARQVLLMDRETLEALDLNPGDIRENITVSGLDFATLEAGRRVTLGGEAVVEVTGPCAPCSRMDEIRPGLKDELQGRRGKLAFVVETGSIGVGDTVGVT